MVLTLASAVYMCIKGTLRLSLTSAISCLLYSGLSTIDDTLEDILIVYLATLRGLLTTSIQQPFGVLKHDCRV